MNKQCADKQLEVMNAVEVSRWDLLIKVLTGAAVGAAALSFTGEKHHESL